VRLRGDRPVAACELDQNHPEVSGTARRASPLV